MKKQADNLLKILTSPVTKRVVVYLLAFAIIAAWAYNRYPVYWDTPNFYAEDGTIFAQHILDKGFWGALFTSFNGYFIFGVYLLEGLAFLFADIFWEGNLLDLSQSLGLVSYLFWAFLCTLPLLLFWNDVKRKSWLILITVSLAVLPLPSFNYAVFTVGNLKFSFLFIALLLLIKRWRLPSTSRWVYAIDASLVLCAFTNATVYLLLPFALLPYWPGWKQVRSIAFLKKLLHNPSFISLLVMVGLVCLQIIYIVMRGGVDQIEGYMQEPFELAKSVEIFLHRTLLFPFDHLFAKQMTNGIVVLASILLVFVLWKFARREDRPIVIMGLWASFIASVLFASQRTGVSRLFNDYTTSGPDHFFYTQNLIILFVVLYILARRLDALADKRAMIIGGVLLCVIPVAGLTNHDVGQASLASRETGSFRYAAQQACRNTSEDPIQVPVYPVSVANFPLDRTTYCTPELDAYIPERQPLALKPYNNNYWPLTADPVTQTFTAKYDQLSGVSVLLANFGGVGHSTYTMRLLDATCQTTIRTSELRGLLVQDYSYANISFAPIPLSKDQKYCFSISPASLEPGKPPLATFFSAPDIYLEGNATKGGNPLSEDVVFDLLYR